MSELHSCADSARDSARQLMKVALGEAEADLAIVNGSVVNVYSGEVLAGDTVLIKGDKVAYVGSNDRQSIGSNTQIIDAAGKTIIPGLIDGHTHILNGLYSISEVLKYALRGGTTAIISESMEFGFCLGYRGIVEFLRSARNQPVKIYATLPPLVSISPLAQAHILTTGELRRLLKRKEVVGLGESFWGSVLDGDGTLSLIEETVRSGKIVDGHSAGARDNKLQAYASLGVTSCHEPTTAEEVRERLRLGMFVMVREGETRRETEAIVSLKDEGIDLRRLILCSDGLGPWQLTTDGYMDFIVQKAIDLGFNPVEAIQMATLNVARRFGLDDFIGGIAPGKYADMVIIPDLKTIKPEYVISNGQVVATGGELLVQPRKHAYSRLTRSTICLTRDYEADDFAVRTNSRQGGVKVRVIDQVTYLVTREAVLELPVSAGQVLADTSRDVIKVAAIDRIHRTGRAFVGFVRGFGFKRGAIATSTAWDTCDIVVAGVNEADMALAVNRVKELNGGIVVCADGKILAEIALPVGGLITTLPMATISDTLHHIQRTAGSLGCTQGDIRQTLSVLTTGGIPFLRICEAGLVDIRQNKFVDLLVNQP